MGTQDVKDQLDVAREYAIELEGKLERIQNAVTSAVDDSIKVSLVSKVLEGH